MEQTCFSVMFWIINILYWPYHLYFINSTLPCSMKTSQYVKECTAVKVKVAQSSPTFCNPMHYAVHGILQARILEWVAFPFSRGSPQRRDRTQVSRVAGGFFTSWAKESQRILEWVTYPFSSGSSWPWSRTGVTCIAGGFFTNWAIREVPIEEITIYCIFFGEFWPHLSS